MQETMSFKGTWIGKSAGILLVASALLLPISTSLTCILFPLATILSLFSNSWQAKIRTIWANPVAIFLIAWMLLYIIGSFYSIAPYQDIFRQLSKAGILLCAALLVDFFSQTRWQPYILNAFFNRNGDYFNTFLHQILLSSRFSFSFSF